MSISGCGLTTAALVPTAMAATGCASASGKAPFEWSEGRREATVDSIGPGDRLKAAARRDCRENLAPEVAASRTFVGVRYRIRRVWHAVIAEASEGIAAPRPGRACERKEL